MVSVLLCYIRKVTSDIGSGTMMCALTEEEDDDQILRVTGIGGTGFVIVKVYSCRGIFGVRVERVSGVWKKDSNARIYIDEEQLQTLRGIGGIMSGYHLIHGHDRR